MPRRFEKSMTRSGPLMMFEVWSRVAESCYAEFCVPSEFLPAEILVNQSGEVTEYIDSNALAFLPDVIQKTVANDPDYFHRIFDEYETVIHELMPMWGRSDAFSREELLHFLQVFSRGWRGLEWAYYVPSIESLPLRIRERALELRHKGERYFDASNSVIQRSLAALYPDVANIQYLTRKEFDENFAPDQECLNERARTYTLVDGNIVSQFEAERFSKQIQSANTHEDGEKALEIINRPGYPGILYGFVRVLTKPEQFDTFVPGEILVTFMTTPNFLPLLKKAAAFITDEGGITCHAAIVSRELQKPCIIGTKIATKALKNGDVVEVDAEKGIVRILSRA